MNIATKYANMKGGTMSYLSWLLMLEYVDCIKWLMSFERVSYN